MFRAVFVTLRGPPRAPLLSLTSATSPQSSRLLYVPAAMGIDGYLHARQSVRQQMANVLPRFIEKMQQYSEGDSKNMIFTEDLKNMLHLAETDEEIDLVVKMMKKFNQQNKQLRFGSFIFGPVVMRFFHTANKPDLALECFKSVELGAFFDQLITYQILLDLLYESRKYHEVLEAFKIITERQVEGARYPRNAVVIALAACYKLNNQEGFDFAVGLWEEMGQAGHTPMRRAVTFLAGLALNLGKPEVALEVITAVRNQNYTTVRNLKVAALAELGRVEDALPILKSVITHDVTGGVIQTFNRDVLEKVREKVKGADSPELTLELQRLEQLFEKEGHLSNTTLDEQLCTEIQKPPPPSDRPPRRFDDPRRPRNFDRFQRPGLKDIA